MDRSLVSMVRIDFPGKQLTEEDMQPIEGLLRDETNIDNLFVHHKMIRFNMWATKIFDYTILNKIKNKLKSLGYLDFEISAEEYSKSGKGYRYPIKEAKTSEDSF